MDYKELQKVKEGYEDIQILGCLHNKITKRIILFLEKNIEVELVTSNA